MKARPASTRSARDLRFDSHAKCLALEHVVVENMMLSIPRAAIREYQPGGLIWNVTDKPNRIFQLRSGRVRVVVTNVDGDETLLRLVKPTELFGEICLCAFADQPHGTTAIAEMRAEVWEARYDDFRRQLTLDSELQDCILEHFCTTLSHANNRIQILGENDARRRLKQLLRYIAGTRRTVQNHSSTLVSVTVTHAELAAHAGLSRPHLSVLMAEFRRNGLVSYKRGSALSIDLTRLNVDSEPEN